MNNHDRARLANTKFYGILDTGYVSKENWITKFDALHKGGAQIIQFRAKKQNSSERKELFAQIHERYIDIPKNNRPILIVNDDIELCLEYPDIGLHIGQDDTPPNTARERLGNNRPIGLSTHSIAQATNAIQLPTGTIDYFAIGPVFPTQTKPNYKPVGLDLVRWTVSKNPSLPFFCIGGINRANAHTIASLGAKQIVTVSDVLCDSDTANAVQQTIAKIG